MITSPIIGDICGRAGAMTPPNQLPAIVSPGALAAPADSYVVPGHCDACASVALGRAIAGTSTRWWFGSLASGCICGVPSITRARSSTCLVQPPTRQSGGAAADPQAAQEARFRAEIAGHRQAALLRRRVPASATHLPA